MAPTWCGVPAWRPTALRTRNRVLRAFLREAQGAIDAWITTAQLLAPPHPDVQYDELPTISHTIRLARGPLA